MKSLLKKFVLFRSLISGVTNYFIRKPSATIACQRIAAAEVDCSFLPLEVLAQIDYVTMLQMTTVSDGRQCRSY